MNQFVVTMCTSSPEARQRVTFSYLTSKSGGGAVTQIAPREQGVTSISATTGEG